MKFIKSPNSLNEEFLQRRLKAESKPSVVEVFFPERHFSCAYYNDKFDLRVGDLVYVEGKLEGVTGRVEKLSYNFRLRLSDYKRVVELADTSVSGELFLAGSHIITLEPTTLPYEQVITWFKALSNEGEEFISSVGDDAIDLCKIDILQKADDQESGYYAEGDVVYFEIKNRCGRAIVLGSKAHEISFKIDDWIVSDLVCDCYCVGNCKHIYAALLQLRNTLKIIDEEYGDDIDLDYLCAVSKSTFFDYVIENKIGGSLKLDL